MRRGVLEASFLAAVRAQAIVTVLFAPLLFVTGGCGPKASENEKSAEAAADAPEVPPAAKVWFVSPEDGAEIKGPAVDGKVKVPVEMGVGGIEVKPAGEAIKGTGHHHIVIDGEPVAAGVEVPKNDTHIHYGGGQTEAELELAPGEHTLTMQFADGLHISYGEKLSNTIKITVVAEG